LNIDQIIAFRFRFQNLLIWLFLYILASPLLATVPNANLIVQALLTAVLFSAAYTIHRKGRSMWPTLALLILTTIIIWNNTLGYSRSAAKLNNIPER